jgi:hypothetical protein
VEHLYREGRFSVADQLVEAAGLEGAGAIRERYTALHTILQQVRSSRAKQGNRGWCGGGWQSALQPRRCCGRNEELASGQSLLCIW